MAETSPNVTNESGIQPYKAGAFDAYVTFCALGGMIVSDTGDVSFKTQEEFCQEYGIDRRSLWRWKRDTPNFAELVRARRDEIVPLSRETTALNRLFVLGMSSIGKNAQHHDQRAAVDALKTYLGHHGKLRLPTQSHEIEAGESLVDIFREISEAEIIEGQVVEPDTRTEKANIQSLPQSS